MLDGVVSDDWLGTPITPDFRNVFSSADPVASEQVSHLLQQLNRALSLGDEHVCMIGIQRKFHSRQKHDRYERPLPLHLPSQFNSRAVRQKVIGDYHMYSLRLE